MGKKKKHTQLPFRVNILFFIIFLVFSVLIIQLGVTQILNGEAFQQEIDRTVDETVETPAPRGKIYDSNYDVVVNNQPVYAITYTPAKGVTAEERLEVAEKLAQLISMDSPDYIDGITERNQKEYWYLKNRDEADTRFDNAYTDEEKEAMDNGEVYNATLDLITEEEISGLTTEQLEVIAIKKEMDKAYELTPQIIKNEGVTAEEYAKVAENLDALPGVNATTDWRREYPYGATIQSLLGNVTTTEQGIPSDQEAYYLTRGYSRNDRVGDGGLEEYYEELLRGRKEQLTYTTNRQGQVVDTEVAVEGQRGKDMVLTLDVEFQQAVDQILREELSRAISQTPGASQYMEDALAVVMNPQNGELLAVAGQHYNRETGEFEDAAYKTLYDAHRPGSIVKGGTVLAGFESGAIEPGTTFFDTPMKVAGTPEKSSWRNLGSVNDIQAIAQSSNVYMFYIALRIGGDYRHPYPYNAAMSIDMQAFDQLRYYYSQLGLGPETGVDFPYEATGYVGTNPKPGNLLDFAIGQYDTYTTMQMAQYVSTIANDGYRVQPHFLKEFRQPVASQTEVGPLYKSADTNVLNRVQMDQDYIDRVQEGFLQVFQSPSGTASSTFAGKPYEPAGKTGTAENEIYQDSELVANTENQTIVGYAPYDNPEIALAVVVPNAGTGSISINSTIAERIMDTYFEMKQNPESQEANNEESTEEENTSEDDETQESD